MYGALLSTHAMNIPPAYCVADVTRDTTTLHLADKQERQKYRWIVIIEAKPLGPQKGNKNGITETYNPTHGIENHSQGCSSSISQV